MIIGLSAKAGCGKTTLANIFLDKHPEYTRLGFADILKTEASDTYMYPNEWNYSEDGKTEIVSDNRLPGKLMTVREVLQWHGTDIRRSQDPDYWVRRMRDVILDWNNPLPYIMIDDVRFKNEAELIKSYNGYLIRLNPYPGWKPGKSADHKSEIELDNYIRFDFVLSPEFGQLKSCLPLIDNLLKGE